MNPALLGLSLAMLSASLGTSSANVALPTLARAFGAPFQAVQWVVIAYLLAITASIVAFGRLGDVHGRRRALMVALSLYGIASIAACLAPALPVLIAARAVQGLGAAGMMALTVAFVGETVPKERIGSAMGLLGTTSSIGTALGPSLGGMLVATLGWRSIFFVHLALGAAALVLARRLPPDRDRVKASFDHAGTLLLALSLAAYALSVTLGRGHFGAGNLALLGAAGAGLAFFVRAERTAEAPLLRLGLLADRALARSLAASAIVSCVVMTSMVVGPFYLSIALGLDTGLVGLTMSVGSVVAALTGFPAGRVVDRFGTRRASLAGLAGIATSALLLSLRPESLGVPGYIAPMAALTASYALFQAANNTGVLQQVEPAERGVVSGTLSLSRNLGLVTGTCVMGAVFALAAGASDITTAPGHAVARGMRTSYALAAALVAVAFTLLATSTPKGRTA
ncbi:MAG: MFS transporter [Byssovorax sp.]